MDRLDKILELIACFSILIHCLIALITEELWLPTENVLLDENPMEYWSSIIVLFILASGVAFYIYKKPFEKN